MESLDAVIEKLRTHIESALKDRPVALAYLYGSAAMGQTTRLSDVDVALVVRDGELAPLERLQLELDIELALAERGIPNTDVRIINDAPLAIRGQVACQGILLYSHDEETRVDFETVTRDEYFDYLPIANQLRKAFFADLRERGLSGQR